MVKIAILNQAPITFFNIFVIVVQYFDLNQSYMQLTVDSMDGTEAGSMTNLNFFFHKEVCNMSSTKGFWKSGFGYLLSVRSWKLILKSNNNQ